MPSLQDMYNEPKPLTAHEKAAILFIAIGGDYAAKVFEHMDEDEIESITLEIANNRHVSIEQKATVISEFYQLMMANDYISTGGLEYAQAVLEKALGAEKATEILNRLTTSLQVPSCKTNILRQSRWLWLIFRPTKPVSS